MNIDKTIALFNQTEGRDKFCKMIQYGSRIIKYNAEGNNETIHNSFNALFSNMSNARKLFRLFKYFNEWVKAKQIMKDEKMPQFDKILSLATRLAFAFYWWFDNLVVGCKIKFFTSMDLKHVSL